VGKIRVVRYLPVADPGRQVGGGDLYIS